MPSIFTPNNDGLNDEFRVLGTSLITEFKFKIFDRYGQLIFQTTDKNGSWDGTFKGAKSATGAYPYFITYKDTSPADTKILKGTILLIR